MRAWTAHVLRLCLELLACGAVGTDKSQYMHAFAYGVAVQLSRTEDKLKMAEDAQSAGYGGGGG
jgi:hypothetical protein